MRDFEAQVKIMHKGRSNMAAVVMVQPGVLAVIIITPSTKRIIASLVLHEDSYHKVA